jgi:hypothetical protein
MLARLLDAIITSAVLQAEMKKMQARLEKMQKAEAKQKAGEAELKRLQKENQALKKGVVPRAKAKAAAKGSSKAKPSIAKVRRAARTARAGA